MALTIEHVTVRIGRAEVVRDLSFAVPRGASVAVIGPNGSGKTVLLRALVGALPHEGTVRWAPGTRIGYVPQKLDLERDLPITGADLLLARARLVGASRQDLAGVLRGVGLGADVLGTLIGTLSGGQFQRLLLAFALMGRPTVLLFDEPTAGVDEPGEESIYALLRRLQAQERLTILLISHELSLVYRSADAVLCLSRRRAWMGPPLEILTPERLREIYGVPLKFHLHDAAGD